MSYLTTKQYIFSAAPVILLNLFVAHYNSILLNQLSNFPSIFMYHLQCSALSLMSGIQCLHLALAFALLFELCKDYCPQILFKFKAFRADHPSPLWKFGLRVPQHKIKHCTNQSFNATQLGTYGIASSEAFGEATASSQLKALYLSDFLSVTSLLVPSVTFGQFLSIMVPLLPLVTFGQTLSLLVIFGCFFHFDDFGHIWTRFSVLATMLNFVAFVHFSHFWQLMATLVTFGRI